MVTLRYHAGERTYIAHYCYDVNAVQERQGGYGYPNFCGVVAQMITRDRVRLF